MMVSPFEIAPGIPIGGGSRPVYIAGPCVIESDSGTVEIASGSRRSRPGARAAALQELVRQGQPVLAELVSGTRDRAGLATLGRVKRRPGCHCSPDVHEPGQVERAAAVADVLQVPAFLCRQTTSCSRAVAAAPRSTSRRASSCPEDMANAVDKVRSTGNER